MFGTILAHFTTFIHQVVVLQIVGLFDFVFQLSFLIKNTEE